MTDVRSPVDWLESEVDDLLEAASVGLYEFVWLLRGEYSEVSEDDYRRIAADALARLLGTGSRRLVWLRWPEEQVLADERRPVSELPPEVWVPDENGRYLALTSD